VALLDSDRTSPTNIGNPGEFTMLDLAREVIELTGSSSGIRLLPLPPEREGDPAQRCPDITVANRELDWEPTISLREGLTRMIDHFRTTESIV
jgi:UDP-glucuronate decarboxylase